MRKIKPRVNYCLTLSLLIYFYSFVLHNYVDDNIQQFCVKNLDEVAWKFNTGFLSLKEWFYENYFALNPRKCYFMTLNSENNFFDFDCDDYSRKKLSSLKRYIRIRRLLAQTLLGARPDFVTQHRYEALDELQVKNCTNAVISIGLLGCSPSYGRKLVVG